MVILQEETFKIFVSVLFCVLGITLPILKYLVRKNIDLVVIQQVELYKHNLSIKKDCEVEKIKILYRKEYALKEKLYCQIQEIHKNIGQLRELYIIWSFPENKEKPASKEFVDKFYKTKKSIEVLSERGINMSLNDAYQRSLQEYQHTSAWLVGYYLAGHFFKKEVNETANLENNEKKCFENFTASLRSEFIKS